MTNEEIELYLRKELKEFEKAEQRRKEKGGTEGRNAKEEQTKA